MIGPTGLVNKRMGGVIMLIAVEIVGKLFLTLAVILVTFVACSLLVRVKLRDYKRWIQRLFIGLMIVDILLFVTTVVLLIWAF